MDKNRSCKISKDQMIDLIARFKTNAEIAEHMDVSRQLIYSIRKKYGLHVVADGKASRNDRILRLYNEGGRTGVEIARKVNLSVSQVYRILWKLGVSGKDLKKKSRWDVLPKIEPVGSASCSATNVPTSPVTSSLQSGDMPTS